MYAELHKHFVGVGAKRISATEAAKANVSNGHELSASGHILGMLGRARAEIPCTYLYFSEEYENAGYVEDVSTATLYDAREKDVNRSPEWRLYYPAGCIPMESMGPGDYCWVAKRTNGDLLIAVAELGSSTARQLDRLFGTNLRIGPQTVPPRADQFDLYDLAEAGDDDLDLADASVLLALGVTPSVDNEDRLPEMIAHFGGKYPLPTTAAFTRYARGVSSISDPAADPDRALHEWVSLTNDLYFTYERHVLQPLLDADLANREHIDVDTFFSLATRFKNARFSRAGASFEQHIAAMLRASGVQYVQPKRLPEGSKPDFLLPSLALYGDVDAPGDLLTFLAAKTTTKERWRQIATEATLIPIKHLITMDRELNGEVLDAMDQNAVVPILPHQIIADYPHLLGSRMMTVSSFVHLAKEKQVALAAMGHL